MEKSYCFQSLAARENAIRMNPAIAGLLERALDDTFAPPASQLGEIQKHFLVTEVACCYQHFGFTLFAPAARELLVPQLAKRIGVLPDPIASWLESVCYFLLEDFNILRLVEGEPEWTSVDNAFFRDLTRRMICAEETETSDLGLDCWGAGLLERLRLLVVQGLELARSEQNSEIDACVSRLTAGLPYASQFRKSFSNALSEIVSNPLRLLIWRVECFSGFSEVRQEAKFFVREANEILERKAYRHAALLALFLPHTAPDGTLLLPASPLSINQLNKVLKNQKVEGWFDCSILTTWLDLDKAPMLALADLLKQSVQLGFLFEVPLGRNQKGYGLSKSALKIVEPFRAAISSSVVLQNHLGSSSHAGTV